MSKIKSFGAAVLAGGITMCADNVAIDEDLRLPESVEIISNPEISTVVEDVKEKSFDIMGGEKFETAVTGKLVNQNGIVFLDIAEYKEPGFEKSLRTAIEGGNTLNMLSPQNTIMFRLGCIEGSDSITEGYSNLPSFGVSKEFTLGFADDRESIGTDCASFADALPIK